LIAQKIARKDITALQKLSIQFDAQSEHFQLKEVFNPNQNAKNVLLASTAMEFLPQSHLQLVVMKGTIANKEHR